MDWSYLSTPMAMLMSNAWCITLMYSSAPSGSDAQSAWSKTQGISYRIMNQQERRKAILNCKTQIKHWLMPYLYLESHENHVWSELSESREVHAWDCSVRETLVLWGSEEGLDAVVLKPHLHPRLQASQALARNSILRSEQKEILNAYHLRNYPTTI